MSKKFGLGQKIRNWYGENKEAIKSEGIRLTWLTVGAVIGGYITNKLGNIYCGRGIEKAHNEGLIKFFDPSNGNEVGVEEANEILKDWCVKKK